MVVSRTSHFWANKCIVPLKEVSRETSDEVLAEKAARFRGGLTADVAEVTFGNEEPWLAVDAEGVVDLDASLEGLRLVEKLPYRSARRLEETRAF